MVDGIVLGTEDSTPLELWVAVPEGRKLELDAHVRIRARVPGTDQPIDFFGVVDSVRKRYEGADFDGDTFLAVKGQLPVEVSYAAHVQITRIEPEIYVPPHPGDPVEIVEGEELARALGFDRMQRRVAIGLTRAGEPLYANAEFLDGTRGAHLSISGVSGVATKTTYASFVLYSLFHSHVLEAAVNTKALIFNVKGEDLLWIDRPNRRLSPEARADYERLGLPAGPFQSVELFAPARRGPGVPLPDTGQRQHRVRAYAWTVRAFAREHLLRFCFTESDDARSQLSMVVTKVERALEAAAEEGDPNDPSIVLEGQRIDSFQALVDLLDTAALGVLMGNSPMGDNTLDAFRRRLHGAAEHVGHLVRGDPEAARLAINWREPQVSVIDIHRLHARAQVFVVGSILKRMMEEKERQGARNPQVFVLLDELNKYAPREGWSPIRDVLLDIAERGRSLGVCLFGAQQTASEVARRVVANAAIKVVGRLDAAESERSEYGFLTDVARLRAKLMQPGSMIVAQPEIPTPLLLRFPFPSWATRADEAEDADGGGDPFDRIRREEDDA